MKLTGLPPGTIVSCNYGFGASASKLIILLQLGHKLEAGLGVLMNEVTLNWHRGVMEIVLVVVMVVM